MDILPFINSSVVREHLRDINYRFNSLEAAWLIFQCKRISYEEKKAAWNQLIAEMPDCPVPERHNCIGSASLHAFLKEYMAVMDKALEAFFQEEPAGTHIYGYSYLYKDDTGWTEEFETAYPSMKACLTACHTDMADLDRTYTPGGTGVLFYSIRKQSLVDTNLVTEFSFLPDGGVKMLLHSSLLTDEERLMLDCSFEGLWFDFPTPFKRGDIVWVPGPSPRGRNECDPFVLLGITPWDPPQFILECGDNSDMNGYGYFADDDGTVYREVMYNYMDLEYYPGPYKPHEKILPEISSFLQDRSDLELLLDAYLKQFLNR